ncbi:MAG: tetratricopeptide repeat protein [Hyphomicrobiaceae bacterium]
MRTGVLRLLGLGLIMLAAVTPAAGQTAPQVPPNPPAAAPAQNPLQVQIDEINALVRAGRHQEARSKCEAVLAAIEAAVGPDHVIAGRVAYLLATIENRLGNRERARELMQRALVTESANGGRTARGFKTVLDELVALELAAGNGRAVGPLYQGVLEAIAAEHPTGHIAEAILRDDWGTHARRLGRFADAEEAFRKALEIKERLLPPTDVGIARTLNNIAGLLRVLGRYEESSRAYVRAIEVWTRAEGPDNANVGIMTDNLGVLYMNMGRVAQAEQQSRRAVEIFEKVLGPDHPTTAVGVSNLAEAFRQMNRYAEAEPLFHRALGILRRHATGPDTRIAVALDNLGGIYRETGRHAEALDSYQKAIAILQQIHPADHPTVGVTTNNIGLAMMALRRHDEAADWFSRGLAIAVKAYGPDHREVATQLLNIGELEQARGRLDPARTAFTRAVAINEGVFGPAHERLAPPLTRLGEVELAARDPAKAALHLRRAVDILVAEQARAESAPGSREGDARHGTEAARDLVEALWRSAGPSDPAARDEAFRTAQLAAATAAGSAVAKLGARLAAGEGPLAVKIRRRQDLVGTRMSLDKKLIAAASEPADRRDRAAEATLRTALSAAESEMAALDREILAAFPDFAALSGARALSVAETRKLLKPNETLVLIVPAGGALHLFAVTTEDALWVRHDVDLRRLVEDVRRVRCGLDPDEWVGDVRPERCLNLVGRLPDANGLPFDLAAAHRLYDILVAPVAALTADRHVLVVTHGPLASLPFQVLVREQPAPQADPADLTKAAWLVRHQPVTMLPSVASLAPIRAATAQAAAGRPYLGIANPLLTGSDGTDRAAFARTACPPPVRGWQVAAVTKTTGLAGPLVRGGVVDPKAVARLSPLPETVDEVCAIADVLGTARDDVLLAGRASETALRTLDASGSLKSYRILHFATHGLVAGEIGGLTEPALVLTPPDVATADNDGLLSASEVATLRLDADWVVLSACNTAAGDGASKEALSGLARAFFYAGARALLVSHWPVRSDAAVRLTTVALDEMKRTPGLARSEALRRSMLALLSDPVDPTFAHPQVWAPFTVVGEGGGTLDQPPAASVVPASLAKSKSEKKAAKKAPKADPAGNWTTEVFKF